MTSEPVTSPPISIPDLRGRIDSIPRQRLAVLPTGLQEVPRLAEKLNTGTFYIKRDDLTGVALGGNKSRLMEFILGDLVDRGCDVLVAGGGGEQSNHAVQCCASANRVGIDSVIVLQQRPDARPNGNALLHKVLGGTTEWVTSDPEIRNRNSAGSRMHEVAEKLRADGRKPYVLESSLHALSVIAYVNATVEIAEQLPDSETTPTRIYVTSEGAALGGLLLGAKLLGLPWEVIGLDWRPQDPDTTRRLAELMAAAAERLGLPCPVQEAEIDIRATGGPAYGVGSPESWDAISSVAKLEGLILDPVYTAKGMAGVFADLEARPLRGDERIVFVHTGGVAALFAYETELLRFVAPQTQGPALEHQ
jgi:1-aminocyclopropane-1-carboxylate deaminase/D-cysteine desulfhydrase-like pyridoxal-dependent ACC family enzyme